MRFRAKADVFYRQTYGIYTLLSPDDNRVYSYLKEYDTERMIVLLNFTKEDVSYSIEPRIGAETELKAYIDNYPGDMPDFSDGRVQLRPYEALVIVFSDI